MCTSFQLSAKNGSVFWGRTMDVGIAMFGEDKKSLSDTCIVNVPKNITIESRLNNWQTKHAVVGVGSRTVTGLYDGINEHGLAGDLQVLKECTWASDESIKERNMQAVLGEEFVLYILTNFKTVKEVRENYSKFALYDLPEQGDNKPTHIPLHYCFIDKTGESIVLEPVDNGAMKCYDSVGVMTNSPEYNYHTVNIRNYVGLNNVNVQERKATDGTTIRPIESGTGYGLFGLPGDFTSPSRFVRSYYIRDFSDDFDPEGGINQLYSAFRSVMVPRGLEHAEKGEIESDYTRYWSGYDFENKRVYVQTCLGLSITSKVMETYLTEITHTEISTQNTIIEV